MILIRSECDTRLLINQICDRDMLTTYRLLHNKRLNLGDSASARCPINTFQHWPIFHV